MYHNYSLEVSALKISFSALFWKKKISCFPRFCTEYIYFNTSSYCLKN